MIHTLYATLPEVHEVEIGETEAEIIHLTDLQLARVDRMARRFILDSETNDVLAATYTRDDA